jgi:hypothetical protein
MEHAAVVSSRGKLDISLHMRLLELVFMFSWSMPNLRVNFHSISMDDFMRIQTRKIGM